MSTKLISSSESEHDINKVQLIYILFHSGFKINLFTDKIDTGPKAKSKIIGLGQ